MLNRFTIVWLPLLLLVLLGLGIAAFIIGDEITTAVTCGQMAFEDADDATPNDGQPRQICFDLPQGVKLVKAPADKPPFEVSSFELINADGKFTGAVVSCEKEVSGCMQIIAAYVMAWQPGDCLSLPKDLGVACRTSGTDSKGNYLAGGFVDFGADLDEAHPDVDIILLAVGTDAKTMDIVRDALLSVTIR